MSDLDSQAHQLFTEYSRRLAPNLIGAVRLSGAQSLVNSDTAVKQVSAGPSLTYRWNPTNTTDLRYSMSRSNYADDAVSAVQNRDANTNVITLSHATLVDYEELPFGINLRAGAFHIDNDADGEDFDYDGFGVFVAAERELFADINANISITRQRNEYDHLNSLTGAGFASQRNDNILRLSLQLSGQLPESLVGNRSVSVFGRYDFTDNDSDVSFFKYYQRVLSIGIAANF